MWSERVLEVVERDADLNAAVQALFVQQRATWPTLVDGEKAWRNMPVRRLQSGEAALVAQANVRRSASTFAKTDDVSIARRACFLCEDNLPVAERAVAFADLMLMPNPFPAVAQHLTIASPDHVPQRLRPRIDVLHSVMRALGPEHFVLYNGPRCGASAPDHFHFQSGRVSGAPVFGHAQLDTGEGLQCLSAGARTAFHLRHSDPRQSADALIRLMDALPTADDEPMVNLLASFRHDHYVALVFPRQKHRTGDFIPGGGGLAISPAGLEMSGVIVVADMAQYESVTAELVERIFSEVCWSREAVEALL